jgi:hypothetical protein
MHKQIFLIIWLACVIARLAGGQGMLITQHSGDNDPTTEGFTLLLSQGSVGPVVGDLGLNAWNTTSSGLYANYQETLTSQQIAELNGQSWDLSLVLRVAEVDTSGISFVQFGSGAQSVHLNFGSESDGDPFVDVGLQQYVLKGAGSTYNTYQVVYNNTTETADLWVDGKDEIHDMTVYPGYGQGFLYWGSGAQSGPASVNWNLISVSAVPEPSAASLLLLGGGGLLYFARLRRA